INIIAALKESSGDLDHIAKIIAAAKPDFYVYSGDDSTTLPIMAIGGTGVVSVASHIIGKEMSEMVQTFLAGDVEKASLMHRELLPTMKGLFITPSPAPLKEALKLKGLDIGEVRLPLVGMTEEEKENLKQLIM